MLDSYRYGQRRRPGGTRDRGGLVAMPDVFMVAHRASIISAASRNNVPAVYGLSDFARDGGLLSYGVDLVDNFRRAATYVDRILRGAKPGDLPVQFPTKFELLGREPGGSLVVMPDFFTTAILEFLFGFDTDVAQH